MSLTMAQSFSTSHTFHFHPIRPPNKTHTYKPLSLSFSHSNSTLSPKCFRRTDPFNFNNFKSRVSSGEAFRDAWRTANDGFEQLLYEAKKAFERLDRRYSLSRRASDFSQAASVRARQLDREFEVSNKFQSLSLDFSRNLPKYRRNFDDFLKSPIGRISSTTFFIWFLLSGWLFRTVMLGAFVLPIAGPFLISRVAKNIVQGACPSCKRQFIGSKATTVRCGGCGNIVWQPEGDVFSRGKNRTGRSESQPEIIDVEFEEK